MALFRNNTHRDIWIEHNCELGCWRPPQNCSILQRALKSDRKPPEWERNTRTKNALMQDSIKCSEKAKQPPARQGFRADHVLLDEAKLFDVEPTTVMDTEHS